MRFCGATSTWHSVVSRTVAGDVVQAAPGTDGSTSFAETTTPRLLTFGDEPRHVDIRAWRYGPRRLRVNDDDDIRRESTVQQVNVQNATKLFMNLQHTSVSFNGSLIYALNANNAILYGAYIMQIMTKLREYCPSAEGTRAIFPQLREISLSSICRSVNMSTHIDRWKPILAYTTWRDLNQSQPHTFQSGV